jgi:hypothetical protein
VGEVAAEPHLVVAGDAVVVADAAIFGRIPVMDPQHPFALERVVVVSDRVQQPTPPDLLRVRPGVYGAMEPSNRLYLPRLMEDFQERGGKLVLVDAAGVEDVNRLSSRHDLMVVAAGRRGNGRPVPAA